MRNGIELLGIFGLSVHEKLAAFIASEWPIPGYDKAAWIKISEALLPLYKDAVQNRGYSIYSEGTPAGSEIRRYLIQASGYPEGIVTAYLYSLEDAAQAGLIDGREYNPAVTAAKSATSSILPAALSPAKISESIFKPLDQLTTKILLIGGVGLVIYFLGKELIHGQKRFAG